MFININLAPPPDPPSLELKLGSNLDLDNIEENDDVYFECEAHGNPEVEGVVWYHNVSVGLVWCAIMWVWSVWDVSAMP